MATFDILAAVPLSAGTRTYPTSGFYEGMDGHTDIDMTGIATSDVHIEVDRYEEGELAETLEMTHDGSGVINTSIHGRIGGEPTAIFPAATGLKVRVTNESLCVLTLAIQTQNLAE